MRSASSSASRPRAIVPQIGQVSIRRALDPHIHFGRRRNQKLALSEIDQRPVRRRIGPPQPAKDEARRVRAAGREKLAADDLEQIAAHEGLLRAAHQRGVFARPVIAFRRQWQGRLGAIRGRRGRARQPGGRAAGRPRIRNGGSEIAAACDRRSGSRRADTAPGRAGRRDAPASASSARTGRRDRSRTRRTARDARPPGWRTALRGPQHRKDRRLPAALFLGETLAAFADLARDPVGAALRGSAPRRDPPDARRPSAADTAPRWLSASIVNSRPRAVRTSGGSTNPMSQRV